MNSAVALGTQEKVRTQLTNIGQLRFNHIDVRCDITVRYANDQDGQKPFATVEASPDLASTLDLSCVNSTLVISMKSARPHRVNDAILTITSAYVNQFTLRGNGDMRIQGLHAGKVRIVLEGNGLIRAEGRCSLLNCKLRGNGEIDTSNLLTFEKSGVFAEGNGQIIHNAAEEATGTISGNARIIVTAGKLKNQRVQGNGAIQSLADTIFGLGNRIQPQIHSEPDLLGNSTDVDGRLSKLLDFEDEPESSINDKPTVIRKWSYLLVGSFSLSFAVYYHLQSIIEFLNLH